MSSFISTNVAILLDNLNKGLHFLSKFLGQGAEVVLGAYTDPSPIYQQKIFRKTLSCRSWALACTQWVTTKHPDYVIEAMWVFSFTNSTTIVSIHDFLQETGYDPNDQGAIDEIHLGFRLLLLESWWNTSGTSALLALGLKEFGQLSMDEIVEFSTLIAKDESTTPILNFVTTRNTWLLGLQHHYYVQRSRSDQWLFIPVEFTESNQPSISNDSDPETNQNPAAPSSFKNQASHLLHSQTYDANSGSRMHLDDPNSTYQSEYFTQDLTSG
ncbi:hypothetical protein MMC28_005071 [Mycoblastus sanguinarius]|nr:hypothetical protein [Mycoblastus sanguinarius]